VEPLTKADKPPKLRRLTPVSWIFITLAAALVMAALVLLFVGE
jgi:hypothetical protein